MYISRLTKILLVIVMLVTTFTHFYRIQQTYNFHNDEGRDALVAKKIIDTKRLVLLGPQTSVGNMYLGPLYYYAMVPALLLTHMDPVGPAIMVALSAILTTYLLFFLGNRWFGWKAGLLAALIFAITPVMVHFTRSSWNPNLVPFIATLTLWCVEYIRTTEGKKKIFFCCCFGFLAGILFQLHYVAVVFVGLCGLYLLTKKIGILGVVMIVIGFFITSSPFWLFEIRHDYVNVRAFTTYVVASGQQAPTQASYLARLSKNTLGVSAEILGSRSLTNNLSPVWLILGGLAVLTIGAIDKKARPLGFLVVGSIFLTSVIHDAIYVHYLEYLFPVVALLAGNALVNSPKYLKYLAWIYFAGYLFVSIPSLISNLNGESSHQAEKGRAVAAYIDKNAEGLPYNVVAAHDNARETTYQYYLTMLKNHPQNESQKLLYIICEDRPCTQADADNPGIYNRGPAHPSLEDELGHPFSETSTSPKNMESSVHTVYGVWVARVIVTE